MRHIQGVFVAVRGQTNDSGMRQYCEYAVAQDPRPWRAGVPENCKPGDQLTSPVSQVAMIKSLAQDSESAEVAVHFLQEFDWHGATAVRIQIYVSDNKGSLEKWQVDLPKHRVENEPFYVHKLPSLPPSIKPGTTSSTGWKTTHSANQGSITVFVDRGKWTKSHDQSIAARRKTCDIMGFSGLTDDVLPMAQNFARLANKTSIWFCFKVQVQPKGRTLDLGDNGTTEAQEQQAQLSNCSMRKPTNAPVNSGAYILQESTTSATTSRKRKASVAGLGVQTHSSRHRPHLASGELRDKRAMPVAELNSSHDHPRCASPIDLTVGDSAINNRALPRTETTGLDQARDEIEEDEQDLHLELRAIRIEQKLRTLMKRKQKQVKVKTERP